MRCYLCGSTPCITLVEARDIRFGCFSSNKQIVQCPSCGLVQLYPQWTPGELESLYQNYWGKQDFIGQKPKVKVSKYLREYIPHDASILEVGCGRGDNVAYLRRKGYDVTGIDKDPTATGIIVDYQNFRASWDTNVIYAIHLFEHLPDPKGFIEWVKKNIREGGTLILEIPSLDDPLLSLYNIQTYREFYWYPYHLFFYNQITIRKMLEGLNISVKLRQEYGIVNHLRWWIKGVPGNWNPHIPILDTLYKFILTKILHKGDTMVIVCSM